MTRVLIVAFTTIIAISIAVGQKSRLSIDAQSSYTIDDPPYSSYEVRLIRPSSPIYVAVISKDSGEQVRGFGLGRLGKATIRVDRDNILRLTTSDKPVSLKYKIIESKTETGKVVASASQNSNRYISLTLRNGSLKSIPLQIPSVMNPNLSPMSNSGVDLRVGQEILFKYKGKRRILLTVSDDIKDGDTIEVSALLKARKREIDGGGS